MDELRDISASLIVQARKWVLRIRKALGSALQKVWLFCVDSSATDRLIQTYAEKKGKAHHHENSAHAHVHCRNGPQAPRHPRALPATRNTRLSLSAAVAACGNRSSSMHPARIYMLRHK